MPVSTITLKHPPMPLEELVPKINGFYGLGIDNQKDFLQELVMRHPVMSYDWGGNWRYRRVRKIPEGHLPVHVDELTWNKNAPAALGRANNAGFPVLYLADRLNTALSEARVENHTVLLSEFQIHPGRSVRIAPIGEIAHLIRSGRGYLAGSKVADLNSLLNACPPDEAKALAITDAFLESTLLNQQDDYELSSTVSMAVLHKLSEVQAVGYRSRRNQGGICFAARTEHFWDTWGVGAVKTFRASHLAEGFYQLETARHVDGITNDGRLVWKEEVDVAEATLLLHPLWTPHSE